MKHYHQGDDIRITVSKVEVEAFASRWPCFGPCRAMSFTFESNGDLVDLAGDSGCDGAGVSALADDAWEYGHAI